MLMDKEKIIATHLKPEDIFKNAAKVSADITKAWGDFSKRLIERITVALRVTEEDVKDNFEKAKLRAMESMNEMGKDMRVQSEKTADLIGEHTAKIIGDTFEVGYKEGAFAEFNNMQVVVKSLLQRFAPEKQEDWEKALKDLSDKRYELFVQDIGDRPLNIYSADKEKS